MASSGEISVISDEVLVVYTWIVFGVVIQIINVFGIATNIINVICFVTQGFEDSSNVSLLGLAISDLGSLTSMVWLSICFTPAMVAADLGFDPIETGYLTSAMIHFAFTRVSGCITAMITLERCFCIMLPLKIKSIITPKRTAVMTICLFVIFTFSGSAVYAVNSLGMKFSAVRNKTVYGLVSTENREHVEKISFAVNNFIIPFTAFVIIVVCTTVLSLKLRKSAKWREKSTASTQSDRVSSRNQKTATMVVMISMLFIVCFIPVNIIMIVIGFLPSLSVHGNNMNLTLLMAGLGFVMESINSSMNIFIYFYMSTKYRDNFCKMFSLINLKKICSY